MFEMKISFGSSPVVSETSNSSPKSQNNRDQIPCISALMNCEMRKTRIYLCVEKIILSSLSPLYDNLIYS